MAHKGYPYSVQKPLLRHPLSQLGSASVSGNLQFKLRGATNIDFDSEDGCITPFELSALFTKPPFFGCILRPPMFTPPGPVRTLD